jgi:hypothetical protein
VPPPKNLPGFDEEHLLPLRRLDHRHRRHHGRLDHRHRRPLQHRRPLLLPQLRPLVQGHYLRLQHHHLAHRDRLRHLRLLLPHQPHRHHGRLRRHRDLLQQWEPQSDSMH